jgi:hypothetical protein
MAEKYNITVEKKNNYTCYIRKGKNYLAYCWIPDQMVSGFENSIHYNRMQTWTLKELFKKTQSTIFFSYNSKVGKPPIECPLRFMRITE